jgi:hypothetical protein
MPEETPSAASAASGVQSSLQAIAKVLRESPPLTPQAQKALAALVDELGETLSSPAVPPAQVTHLAESTAQLIQSIHHKHEEGVLISARDRLEQAILNAESHAPFAAGLARRLLDTLANLGI